MAEQVTQQRGKTGNKPGMKRPKKLTQYGEQLQEKQKARRAYGLKEEQFRRYFNAAARFRGQTGEILLQTLERRLDNVIFRAGLAKTRAQARQLISHRHIMLNKQRVSIASIIVNEDDLIKPYRAATVTWEAPAMDVSWLKTDKKTGQVTVSGLPKGNDLPIEFDTQKIIEYYSR